MKKEKNFMKTRLLLSLLGIVFVLTSFISAHSGEDDFAHHSGCLGGMMSGNYGMSNGVFGWTMGLLVIVVLVLLIIWLIKLIQKK